MADVIRDADVIHFQKSLPPTTQVAIILSRWLGKPVHQDWDDYEFAFWTQAARDAWHSGAPLVIRLRKAVLAAIKSLVTGSMERLIPNENSSGRDPHPRPPKMGPISRRLHPTDGRYRLLRNYYAPEGD